MKNKNITGTEDSKWKLEKREVIHENPWYEYVHDSGKTDTGRTYDYFYVNKKPSTALIALTEDQQLILVREYHYTTNRDSLEVPGGASKDPSLTIEQVAKRELEKETGYTPGHMEKLLVLDGMNGHSNDQVHIFLMRGCKKSSEQNLDETEEGMRVELHSVENVFEMAQSGAITDSLTLAALLLAWPHIL